MWARCLVQAAAFATHANNEASWVQLAMLPKCVLRPHARGGRSSRNATEAETKALCTRWLEGERASLWAETTERRGAKRMSRASQNAQRCLELGVDVRVRAKQNVRLCLAGSP